MTEKLFYSDSHLREFTAEVVSCEKRDGHYEVELDRTAFFLKEAVSMRIPERWMKCRCVTYRRKTAAFSI